MSDLLPSAPLLTTFLVASFLLAITPGPIVFYVVTRSITQGRSYGLASVAGASLGTLCNALGASLGLAALFAISSLAFTVVKYLGAMYLIWLGIQTLRAPRNPNAPAIKVHPAARGRIVLDGFIVGLLNPKTAIFFAAFLPQFAEPAAPAGQTIVLGVIFVLLAAFTDSCYALAAGSVRPWLQRATGFSTAGRYISGGAFIGLGLLTAFSGQRARA